MRICQLHSTVTSFNCGETSNSHSVAALTSSSDTPSISSVSTNPRFSKSTSNTHKSVMILLTACFPVNGNSHSFLILLFPFLSQCSRVAITLDPHVTSNTHKSVMILL